VNNLKVGDRVKVISVPLSIDQCHLGDIGLIEDLNDILETEVWPYEVPELPIKINVTDPADPARCRFRKWNYNEENLEVI
jgi:hypothetical protein